MSLPLSHYRQHPDEIPDRLAVLFEKCERITAYDASLDPVELDEKQLVTMVKYQRIPGIDVFPEFAFWCLRRTIDCLKSFQQSARDKAAA